jgi:hypothetical protein
MYFVINSLRRKLPTNLVTDKKTANIQVNFISLSTYSYYIHQYSIRSQVAIDFACSYCCNFAVGPLCTSSTGFENYNVVFDLII